MTDAANLLEQCRALGATFTLVGNRLRVNAPQPLPDTLVSELKERKEQVLRELSRERRDSSECWVLEEWRRLSLPEWRRILRESVDKGDKKREEYARWMLFEVLEAERTGE